MRYQLWISLLRLTPETALGRCKEVAIDMQDNFPELRLVRGHYYDDEWGRRGHWWLQLGDRIVDPTAIQFPSAGEGRYEEHPEGAEEPTGICMNCGEYVYGGSKFCNNTCEAEFIRGLERF